MFRQFAQLSSEYKLPKHACIHDPFIAKSMLSLEVFLYYTHSLTKVQLYSCIRLFIQDHACMQTVSLSTMYIIASACNLHTIIVVCAHRESSKVNM